MHQLLPSPFHPVPKPQMVQHLVPTQRCYPKKYQILHLDESGLPLLIPAPQSKKSSVWILATCSLFLLSKLLSHLNQDCCKFSPSRKPHWRTDAEKKLTAVPYIEQTRPSQKKEKSQHQQTSKNKNQKITKKG